MPPDGAAKRLLAIDDICEQFEDALRAGAAPRIEDFLSAPTDPDSSLLFRYLLLLDWEYCAKEAGTAAADARMAYRRRFPDFSAIVDEVVGPRAVSTTVDVPAAGGAVAVGRSLGSYTLLALLGRGGMGEVFLARHEGLRRLAALKMVRGEYRASPELFARFRTEAEAIARLAHPNIVQVFDVGEHEGVAYLALEYVAGGTLAARLDGTPWPASRAAELMEPLARGVAAAHRAGVVHRDLKPGNILLASGGREPPENESPYGAPSQGADAPRSPGGPKIADFGLAKILEGTREQTASGLFLGTPTYCAPEQAAGRAHEIGPLVDVYALGVILYELLTGRPPFQGATLEETLGQVLNREPVAPRLLVPSVDRYLETICLKCLEKLPARRYASAEDLAEDLRRFRAGEPIVARPVSAAGRLVRWARRNPGLAAALSVLAVVLLTTTTMALIAAERFRDLAAQEAQLRGTAEEAQEETRRNLYYSQMFMAGRAAESPSGIVRLRELVQQWQPRAGKVDLRGWEWRHFRALCGDEERTIATDEGCVGLEWSPDGSRLALAHSRHLSLLDPKTGATLRRMEGLHFGLWHPRWSPDGRRLAVPAPERLLVLEAASLRPLDSLPLDQPILQLAWHPSGTRLFFTDDGSAVRVWDVGTARSAVALPGVQAGYKAHCGLLSPDGTLLAFQGREPRYLALAETRTGKEVRRFADTAATFTAVAWRGDGARLAAATDAGRLTVWDLGSGKVVWSRPPDGHFTPALAWSPDGRRLAWGNWNHAVRVWDLEENEEVALLRGHEAPVQALGWSPDGRRLATTGNDGVVAIWDLARPPAAWTRDLHGLDGARVYLSVAWSRDGLRLATSYQNRGTVLWNAGRGERAGEVRGVCAAWDAEDARLAVVFMESVFLWSADGRTELASVELRGQPKRLAWNPRRSRLAIRAADRIWLWDGTAEAAPVRHWGEPLKERDIPHTSGGGLAWHPDGERLAFGIHRGDKWFLVVWDVSARAVVHEREVGSSWIEAVAWSADGRSLAVSGEDPVIRLWDATTWEEARPLRGHDFRVYALAWHPDGTRLASASENGSVRVWDPRTGDVAFQVELGCAARSVAWSDDGKKLATLGANGLLRVWDATRGYGE